MTVAPHSASGSRTLYFSYGANMATEAMATRCPEARLLGPALLDGHAFLINARHFATITPAAGKLVHGVLWLLTAADRHALDEYEGIAIGLYRRHTVRVETPDGRHEEALAYMAGDRTPTRTRDGYLDHIVRAAREHGFPDDYLAELEAWRA